MSAPKRVSVRQDLLDAVFGLIKQGTFNVPFGRVMDLLIEIQTDARSIEPPKDQPKPEPTIQRMPNAPTDNDEIVITDLAGNDASVKE